MKKLVVIDSGNVMHKSIFAVIAQIHSEMYKIAKEKGVEDFNVKEFDDLWYDIFETLENKHRKREIFIMNPTTTYLKMIIGYLKKISVTLDDLIIVAEDFGSWRKAEDKDYKAQRAGLRENKMPNEWWKDQYQNFNDFISEIKMVLPWHFIKIYKDEADDVASVAIRFIDAEEKIMISGDRDWEMLCAIPNTKIFSPYTKKYKIVKDPESVLAQKIKGDISDNLITVPQNEAEWEKRKLIVNLLELPNYIEEPIKDALFKLTPKQININKLRYAGCRKELQKLYNL